MTPNLQERSQKLEMIDLPGISKEERIKNMRELDVLGKISGGNYYSWKVIYKLLNDKNSEYRLVDLGCGGGETLKYFAKSAKNKDLKMKFTGVDKSDIVIDYMNRNCSGYNEIVGINTDFENFLTNTSQKIDIIYCSLFCHHLENQEIICLMRKVKARNSVLIIHDLSRSTLLYYGSYIFTRVYNCTVLAKHDGPISVARGFKRIELENMAIKAGFSNFKYMKIPFFKILMVLIP
jgi:SAM-dependent methyltransferase